MAIVMLPGATLFKPGGRLTLMARCAALHPLIHALLSHRPSHHQRGSWAPVLHIWSQGPLAASGHRVFVLTGQVSASQPLSCCPWCLESNVPRPRHLPPPPPPPPPQLAHRICERCAGPVLHSSECRCQPAAHSKHHCNDAKGRHAGAGWPLQDTEPRRRWLCSGRRMWRYAVAPCGSSSADLAQQHRLAGAAIWHCR